MHREKLAVKQQQRGLNKEVQVSAGTKQGKLCQSRSDIMLDFQKDKTKCGRRMRGGGFTRNG